MTKTKIEWVRDPDGTPGEVWNIVTGYTKVSEGCRNCYAERIANRFWKDRKFTDVRVHEEKLGEPLRWKKPRRVFVNSMSDLFHPKVSEETIANIFVVMALARQHTFMILTKRPERMVDVLEGEGFAEEYHECMDILSERSINGVFEPARNVWLGVSVETQKTADERIPLLLATPAAVRFVSAEPLIGPVILREEWMPHYDPTQPTPTPGGGIAIDPPNYRDKLNWVICGGESGPGARPMHPDWARGLRDACQRYQVPYFMKQWGEWAPGYPQYGDTDAVVKFEDISEVDNVWARDEICLEDTGSQAVTIMDGEPLSHQWQPRPDRNPWWMLRTGKKAAGRELDGRTWDEVPTQGGHEVPE